MTARAPTGDDRTRGPLHGAHSTRADLLNQAALWFFVFFLSGAGVGFAILLAIGRAIIQRPEIL